jgi:outer membrane protein assembly factor BamB
MLLLPVAGAALAEDWPQFRGPGGQGHSTAVGLPLEWSESRNVLWRTPVPESGWSSPVVADGRVWLTTGSDGALRVLAFDVETGSQLVDAAVFPLARERAQNPKNSLASPTPVVRGNRVFSHFGADGTAALTTGGEVLWRERFPYESQHGNGGSPVLYQDLLLFSCDGYDTAFVVAIEAETGKVRWKTPRRRPISQAYSTPLVIRAAGRDQLVSAGAFRATAYDPASGEELWWVSYADGFSNVPRPVYGHGLVFIATGFQVPALLAVRADGEGDVTSTHVDWKLERGAPLTPSPLLVGDELFVVNDRGIATVLDARSGRVHWLERLPGNYSASPVYADGRIYVQSEEGVTTVLAAGKEHRVLATNRVDGLTLASMAVAEGSFFLRSRSHLYRIAERESGGGGTSSPTVDRASPP